MTDLERVPRDLLSWRGEGVYRRGAGQPAERGAWPRPPQLSGRPLAWGSRGPLARVPARGPWEPRTSDSGLQTTRQPWFRPICRTTSPGEHTRSFPPFPAPGHVPSVTYHVDPRGFDAQSEVRGGSTTRRVLAIVI